MSMLDAFFNKSFKAVKCKTLLKLTIPRIKLIRNRKEIQIRQMRKDIAKLLESGQEATARIRVEHIIRENSMMDAQEIIELFCELISVRLPMIEAQRECPLDLKEAISSVCFSAPRCAELPELMQVQMLFAAKYGKEFVSAATELVPDCGVNRQLIELLSVRAPAPDVKLNILKEIAEEHDLDWDPAASETEFFKTHEDLLNGPTQFVSRSKSPLFGDKIDESSLHSSPDVSTFDPSEFPKVPQVLLPASEIKTPLSPTSPHPQESPQESPNPDLTQPPQPPLDSSDSALPNKQFLPFILSSSSLPSTQDPPIGQNGSFQHGGSIGQDGSSLQGGSVVQGDSVRQGGSIGQGASVGQRDLVHEDSHRGSGFRAKSEVRVDLNDVLAAARAAAESAECAAFAARSAASLAEVRIAELIKNNDEGGDEENPFGGETCNNYTDRVEEDCDGGFGNAMEKIGDGRVHRVASMEDEMYPNLFKSHGSNLGSG